MNIIFQHHLCKLGQLNGRNLQVLSQAMKKRPTGHYKKYSHFKGRDTAPTTSSRVGSCIVNSSTSGLAVAKIPGRRGDGPGSQPYGAPQPHGRSSTVCRRFNEGWCRYARCRFRHQCSECGVPHPLVSCPRNSACPQQRSRSTQTSKSRVQATLSAGRPA